MTVPPLPAAVLNVAITESALAKLIAELSRLQAQGFSPYRVGNVACEGLGLARELVRALEGVVEEVENSSAREPSLGVRAVSFAVANQPARPSASTTAAGDA